MTSYLFTHGSHRTYTTWRALWTLQQKTKQEMSLRPSNWWTNIQLSHLSLGSTGQLLISGLMGVYINHTYIGSTWTLRTSRTRGTRRALQKEKQCWDEIKELIKVFTGKGNVSHHGANITILSLLTRRSRKSLKMPKRNEQSGFPENNHMSQSDSEWIENVDLNDKMCAFNYTVAVPASDWLIDAVKY